MSTSPLAAVEMAPRDPILGITELFNADKNPAKVNLGVGVYCDDSGKLPVLECVRTAEQQLAQTAAPRGYLPIDGLAAYDKAVQELVFGASSAARTENRIVTVQALGGTGGLKVGADFLKRIAPSAQVWISDPSWENPRGIFTNAGFEWREPGCSMCLGMNPDKLSGREVCASSSNRNFKGRQGSPTGRTLLMSPAMVAAAAVTGKLTDVRKLMAGA